MPISPDRIDDLKHSTMLVHRADVFTPPTPTNPDAKLHIFSGIAVFSFTATDSTAPSREELRILISADLNVGNILEATSIASMTSLDNIGQNTGLWAIESAQVVEDDSNVVLEANIAVMGAGNHLSRVAYHVTVLEKLS